MAPFFDSIGKSTRGTCVNIFETRKFSDKFSAVQSAV